MNRITLLVFTLNEIDGMKEIMPRIDAGWYDQVIIVDGGSTDGTLEYARSNNYPVHVQREKGLHRGFMEVHDMIEGDIIVTFSPDGNSIPELIPRLTAKMKEGYDMVIVSRYKGSAKSYDDDAVTRFGNWMFTKLINLLFNAQYTDAMVIFRAYRKDLVKDLDLDKEETYLPEKWFFTSISREPVLSVRCAKKRLRTAEISGDEPRRIGGKRKLQIMRWGLAYFFQILREKVYWKK
ncbi:MAG: glycosyltransferase family 2 protein [Elusimicrobia bacterium]|nr:glycosyltransferase family 2 protein [Elusimicrobiota bacterium]